MFILLLIFHLLRLFVVLILQLIWICCLYQLMKWLVWIVKRRLRWWRNSMKVYDNILKRKMSNMRSKPTKAIDKSSLNWVIGFGCIWEKKDFQPVDSPSYILEGMVHFKSLRELMIMHTSWIFQISITLVLHLMFLIFLLLM